MPPPPSLSSWDVVRYSVGALLLISATLKLHHLLTSPLVVSTEWLAAPRVQWLTVGWESALALWLWSGCQGKWSRWAAIITFAVFAAVSLSDGIAGKRTCCCFGAVQAQPWLVFVLDLGIVVWLYRTRPAANHYLNCPPRIRTATISLAALCLTAGLTAAAWHQPPKQILQILDWPTEPLVIEQGGRAEWKFRIYNAGLEATTIDRTWSNCECFEVSGLGGTIAPLASIEGVGAVDTTRSYAQIGKSKLTANASIVRNGETCTTVVFSRDLHVAAPGALLRSSWRKDK